MRSAEEAAEYLRTLSTLVRQSLSPGATTIVLHSLRHPQDTQSDVAFLLTTVGKLWLTGLKLVTGESVGLEKTAT